MEEWEWGMGIPNIKVLDFLLSQYELKNLARWDRFKIGKTNDRGRVVYWRKKYPEWEISTTALGYLKGSPQGWIWVKWMGED